MEAKEQGGDSHMNNADDWKSKHEPDLRRKVLSILVQKLKAYFPTHSEIQIKEPAVRIEEKIYAMAKNKDDYVQKIIAKIMTIENKFRDIQSGSPVNGTSTLNPEAQILNQKQALPSSLVYTQNPRSQQWSQQNIQSNLNIPGSSALPTQVPITISEAQSVTNQMGEGVQLNLVPASQIQKQGRQELPTQQPQNSKNMFQHQALKDKVHHGNFRPLYTQQHTPPQQQQQQHHQKSLLHQPTLQQLPHQTSSLSPTQQSVSALSRLPSSGLQTSIQQNSQFLPRNQFPPQKIHSSHQQQMAMLSQKNNIASFPARAQHKNNLHVSDHQQRLCNIASALPSREQQNMTGSQSGNFSVPGSSLLGTHGQEVGQSPTVMLKQYQPQHPVQQQFQNRSLPQHLQNDTQRFQAAASQDSTCETVNASRGDWQEETYNKIKALKEMYFPFLSTMLQKVEEKLSEIDSLPQQGVVDDATEKLRKVRSTVEQVIMFLNARRSSVSEKHRDNLSIYEEQISKLTKRQTMPRRPMQQVKGQFPPSQMQQTVLQSQSHQVNVSKSLEKDQINSQWIRSDQNPAIKQQVVSSNICSVQSSVFQKQQQLEQFHHSQMQQQLLPRQQQQQTNEMNDVRKRQRIDIKGGLLEQHHSSSQLQLPKPMDLQMRNSPSASSPQIQHHSSPQLADQRILLAAVNKKGTPSQSGGSPSVVPSPVTLVVSSPIPPVPITERPIDRLIKAFRSSSPKSLAESLSEMSSVVSLADRMAGSFHSSGGSRAGLAEDLSANVRLQARNLVTQEDTSLESSGSKVNRIEPCWALLQEINEINARLVETVVNICDEDVYPSEVTSGTIVTCSYTPVALSATLKAHYQSGHIIEPLILLVPVNYPYSSPVLLEKFPFDDSIHKYEDLSARARLRFRASVKTLSEPKSLKDIVQTWNDCGRATITEYAERHGGGTFSSKYGSWEEPILRAS